MKNLNKSLVSGIDEAGRGSIIGPLVIASVTANKKTIKKGGGGSKCASHFSNLEKKLKR